MFFIFTFLFTQLSFAQTLSNGIHPEPCLYPIPEEVVLKVDFARFCKYETLNKSLPPATKNRVVYFGDSITEGWLKRIPGITDDTINRGVGGQTSTQMLIRFRADVLNLNPKIVHIMAGTNDIAGNTGPTSYVRMQEAIMSMVEQARVRGIRVILGSIPPAKSFGWNPTIKPRAHIQHMNKWLQEYAKHENLIYADYHSQLVDRDGGFESRFTFDGVHPNSDGYAIMEAVAKEALKKANF